MNGNDKDLPDPHPDPEIEDDDETTIDHKTAKKIGDDDDSPA